MTQKEKLLELIHEFGLSGYEINDLADYLLANGVVVPVRCGECKHMIKQSHTRYCTVWNACNGHGDDGYCCYGERIEHCVV